MKTCIPRRILTEWSYIKGLHAISATTMRSVGIRHWTNELRLRYTMESIFINHARIRCSTPPSALRAAPAGTGSAPQRIRQRPKRHETRTPGSTLKWPISGPKDGGRGIRRVDSEIGAKHWVFGNPWALLGIVLTTPCAKASSHPWNASCSGKTASVQGRRRNWQYLLLLKAGTTRIGDILLSTTCRPWLMKKSTGSLHEAQSRKSSTESGELQILGPLQGGAPVSDSQTLLWLQQDSVPWPG